MIRLKKPSPQDIKHYQSNYQLYRSVQLKQVIDKSEVEKLYQQLSSCPLENYSYNPSGEELGSLFRIDVPNKVKFFLDKFISQELVELLLQITEKKHLIPHQLDLYSQRASEIHFLGWHTDREEDDYTTLGLCLPVSNEERFEGAEFQIRKKGSTHPFNTISPRQGDIYLFDIDEYLEHRTSPITSGERISLTYFFKPEGERFKNS